MKKGIIILFAATLGLAACNNYKKGEGDLQYKILKSEGKEKIKEGDFVKLNGIQTIETKSNGDSTLVNTYDQDRPAFFPISKSTFKGDMVAALELLGEGDSAVFKLNLDSMAKYSGQPKPATAKTNYATFTVKIEKVLRKKANQADSLFEKDKREFFESEYKALINKNKNTEGAKIKKYIADNNIKATTSASGLLYEIKTPGDAARAANGDTLMVNYTGRFTNKKADGKDNVFDTSDAKVAQAAGIHSPMAQYGARPIVMGQVVPGFNEGLGLIGKGGKIVMVIPSKLAYGENGGGPINPFTPLVFEVELTDIKKPKTPVAPVAPAPVAPIKK
jgi:FKBP-type peptidyl-prolyl cis-trans isomerase FkpA